MIRVILTRKPPALGAILGDVVIREDSAERRFVTLEPMGEEIPKGTYSLVMDHSPKFGRTLPHVLNVPNRDGIRIHSGNTAKDSDGCILIGTTSGPGPRINESRSALTRFMEAIETLAKREKIILIVQ